jgi:hypothetical protein
MTEVVAAVNYIVIEEMTLLHSRFILIVPPACRESERIRRFRSKGKRRKRMRAMMCRWQSCRDTES